MFYSPDLTSQANELQQTVNGLQSALTVVGNNVIANSSAINGNANTIGALQTSVNDNGTAIGNLQTGVTANSTAIASATSNVANVQAGVNANGTAISSATSNISAVQAGVLANGTAITGVQGNVTFGTELPTLPNIATYEGNLVLSSIVGNVSITNKIIRGNVKLDASSVASITALNFTGNTINGQLTNSPLRLDNATTINLGSATVTGVIAPKATTIHLGQTANAAGLTVSTTFSGGTINLGLTSSAGALTIVGSETTVNLNSLATAAAIKITSAANVNAATLDSANALNIGSSGTVNLSDLDTFNGNSSIGGTTVQLNVLATGTGTLTLPNATSVTFPNYSSTVTVTADKATSLTMKSANTDLLSADAATSITLTEQSSSVSITQGATSFPAMTTLNVSAGAANQIQDGVTTTYLNVTAAATLTTLVAGGKLDVVTTTGTGLKTVNTTGYITDLNLTGANINAVDLKHSFIGLDTAPQIVVTGTILTALDLSAIEKVKTINVTGNTSLVSITPPSTVLAEAAAAISVITTNNSFTGTYTEGATGTQVSETEAARAAIQPIVTSATASMLISWFNLAAAKSTVATSTNIEIDNITIYYRRSGVNSATLTASATSASFDLASA